MKVRAPFIFDREQEAQGILHPDTLLGFQLGWKGWRYYIAHPWSRCVCGTLAQNSCCHKCKHCNCELGS